MLKAERHQRILQVLHDTRSVEVKTLSQLLGVSEVTVRRDLLELSEDRRLERHHGGAVLLDRHHGFVEPPIHARLSLNQSAKRAIGAEAAKLVQDGDTVYISGGTTTIEVARHLTGRRNVKVITPAINIIAFLASYPEVTVIVPGGVLVHEHQALVGHIAQCALRELRADRAIMGAAALSVREGITAETLQDAETDRMVMAFAPELVLVADSSKFGVIAPAWIAPISRVHHLVTDEGVPPADLEHLRAQGVNVRVAESLTGGDQSVVRNS